MISSSGVSDFIVTGFSVIISETGFEKFILVLYARRISPSVKTPNNKPESSKNTAKPGYKIFLDSFAIRRTTLSILVLEVSNIAKFANLFFILMMIPPSYLSCEIH